STGYTNPGYLWQVSADSGKSWTDIPNSNAISINLNAPSTIALMNYKYRMLTGEGNNINSVNCRVSSNTTILNVRPKPSGKLSGTNICLGSNANLIFTTASTLPKFSITYTDGINSYSQNNLDNNSAFLTPYMLTDTTTFILTSVTDAGGCTNYGNIYDSAIKINVNPLPQAGISGMTICNGQPAYLNFSATQGVPLFTLEITDGTNLIKIDSASVNDSLSVPKITNSTSYTLLSLTDKTGCSRTSNFLSANATIDVNPSPQISFAALPAVCKNDSPFVITQAAETSGLPGTGLFSGDGVANSGLFSPASVTEGTHPIEYKYLASNGCTDSATQNITVNSLPIANAGPDIIGCANTAIQLNATGGAGYLWMPPDGLDNASIPNPVAMVKNSTNYIVKVTSADGCIAYDSLNIIISQLGKAAYKVPNAFTPNGDGKNDCFGIGRWGGIVLQEFSIYNRWGQRVFATTNPSKCWDGTFNGIPQDSGGYVYIIHAITPCGLINLKGTVLLIR
ncbi:MAG TPA: gliding motility-associated C-terminal domain-containing protein, partial [Puia sp.]|nr:gliding motility-associated C-terminal domain-containing protein [Puia sp.]